MSKPLLTFAVAAFNQEAFIGEAVRAAFSQTYSPLEVVLSDDCSGDRTFQIIEEMAAAYRGPHRVVVNRNPRQLSIGGHVNRVVEISQGELIVGAAGDDVSFPERTQICFDAWEKSGRKATSIHSSYIQIDEGGNVIGKVLESEKPVTEQGAVIQEIDPVNYVQTLEPIVFGCAHTFSRALFRVFGNLPDHIIHEDNALALRSALAGKLMRVGQPLVKYRVHDNNIYIRSRERAADLKTLERQEARLRRDLKNREVMCEGFLIDLECARRKGLISKERFEQAYATAARKRKRFGLELKFLNSGLLAKCRILIVLWRQGLNEPEKSMLMRRLLPLPLLLRVRLAFSHLAASRTRQKTAFI